MNITFNSGRAINLALRSEDSVLENTINLGFDEIFLGDRSFEIRFELELKSTEGYFLEITYSALFSTSEVITEDFKNSLFPKVNAPAIAYPYLRSFISIVSLNSGYEPAILPTINFQAMLADSQD